MRELREMREREGCEAERTSWELLVILLVRERAGENGFKCDCGEEERRSSVASSSSSSKAVIR